MPSFLTPSHPASPPSRGQARPRLWRARRCPRRRAPPQRPAGTRGSWLPPGRRSTGPLSPRYSSAQWRLAPEKCVMPSKQKIRRGMKSWKKNINRAPLASFHGKKLPQPSAAAVWCYLFCSYVRLQACLFEQKRETPLSDIGPRHLSEGQSSSAWTI